MIANLVSKLADLSLPANLYTLKSDCQQGKAFSANRRANKSRAVACPSLHAHDPGLPPSRMIIFASGAHIGAVCSRTGLRSCPSTGTKGSGIPSGGSGGVLGSARHGPSDPITAAAADAGTTAAAPAAPPCHHEDSSCSPIRPLPTAAASTHAVVAAAAAAAATAANNAVRAVQAYQLEWLCGFRSTLRRLATAARTAVSHGSIDRHVADLALVPPAGFAAPTYTAAVPVAPAAPVPSASIPAAPASGETSSSGDPDIAHPARRSCSHSDSGCLGLGVLGSVAQGPGATPLATTPLAAGSGSGSNTARSTAPTAAAREARAHGRIAGVKHLIVMANGLFGSPSNWSVISEQLREHLDMPSVLLHPSQVNRRTDTYDGIDVCGQRLAQEIRRVAAAHPSLERISVIGHSMGGLLLRYAIGLLYDPTTGRVAGLAPCHFISLATPHMGCDSEGLAQVPFIGWAPDLLQPVLQSVSTQTAGLIFRRTGQQFFLADADKVFSSATIAVTARSTATFSGPNYSTTASGSRRQEGSGENRISSSSSGGMGGSVGGRGGEWGGAMASRPTAAGAAVVATTVAAPLLYRMTLDEPHQGQYFYSGLASFASRTAYANTDGDHLVGWANSSLRFLHQLPQLPPEASKARGVVLQDPLLAAFDVRSKPEPEPQTATSRADLPIDLGSVYDTYGNNPSGSDGVGGGGLGAAGAAGRGADVWAPGVRGVRHMTTAAASGTEEAVYDSDAGNVDGGGGGGGGPGPTPVATAAMAETMLRRLQRLPWRRVDVSFQGASWGFAHNNIQVTRRWLNFEGMAVAHHLALQVAALEAEWARREAVGRRWNGQVAAGTRATSAGAGADLSAGAGADVKHPAAGAVTAQESVSPLLPPVPLSAQGKAAPYGPSRWAATLPISPLPSSPSAPSAAAAAAAAAAVAASEDHGRSQGPLLTEAAAAELLRQLAEVEAEDKPAESQAGPPSEGAARAEASAQL